MLGLNSSFAPSGEEPLQTFVFEACNHPLSVTYMVTAYKRPNGEKGAGSFSIARCAANKLQNPACPLFFPSFAINFLRREFRSYSSPPLETEFEICNLPFEIPKGLPVALLIISPYFDLRFLPFAFTEHGALMASITTSPGTIV